MLTCAQAESGSPLTAGQRANPEYEESYQHEVLSSRSPYVNNLLMIYQAESVSSAALMGRIHKGNIQVFTTPGLLLFGMFRVSPDCLSGINVTLQMKATFSMKEQGYRVANYKDADISQMFFCICVCVRSSSLQSG